MKKLNPFKNRKQQEGLTSNSKIIGGHLPLPLVYRLKLIAAYQGENIQWVLQQMAETWSESIGKSNEELIKGLAEKAIEEWNRRKKMEGILANKKAREEYLQEIKTILCRRKISHDHVEMIISEMKTRMNGNGGMR